VYEIEAEDNTGEGIDSANEKIEESGDTAKESGLKFTEMNSAMEAGLKVVELAQQAYAALIQPTVDLGLATDRTSKSLGISTEEASLMIQMLGDYGLSVDEATNAMEMAVKRGYTPTIAGLEQMADDIVSLNDPVKEGALLFDVFGEKGQDVGKLLREGSEGVAASAAQLESLGLAMSQEDVDTVTNYRDAMNDLGDIMASVGMVVSMKFLPPIVEAMNALYDLLTMRQQISDMVGDTGERLAEEGKTYEYYVTSALDVLQANGQVTQGARALIEAQLAQGKSLDVVIQGSGVSATSMGILSREQFNNVVATNAAAKAQEELAQSEAQAAAEAAKQAAELSASYSVIISMARSIQAETDSYTQKQSDLTQKISETKQKEIEAAAQYGVSSDQVRTLQSEIATLTDKYTQNEAEHARTTAKIVYDNVYQKLSIDGLTDAEFAMAQQMGVSLNIFTQASAQEATALNGLASAVVNGKISQEQFTRAVNGGKDSVQQLWDKINAIPKHTDININTNRRETYSYEENRVYREARIITRQASGGDIVVPPGYYENYLVAFSSGEHIQTTPSSRVGASEKGGSGSGSGGNTYQFIIQGVKNAEEVLRKCYDSVERQGGLPQA